MRDIERLNERLVENAFVVSIHIDIEEAALRYNLLLSLSDSEHDEQGKLVLLFYDVSNLRLVEFGGGLTQFLHLKLSRISGGLDRKNFSLNELEHGNIAFDFAAVDELR